MVASISLCRFLFEYAVFEHHKVQKSASSNSILHYAQQLLLVEDADT